MAVSFTERLAGTRLLLLRGLWRNFEDEGAGIRALCLGVALLENLNLHWMLLVESINRGDGLAEVVDDDVDEPGAECAFLVLLLVGLGLHGFSWLTVTDVVLIAS